MSLGKWSGLELDFIIESLLYSKYDSINKILTFINNKTLDDLVLLLTSELIIGGNTSIKVEVLCDVCHAPYLITPSKYRQEHHYCSFDCRNSGFLIYGSHRKEKNGRYNSKDCSCSNCGKIISIPMYKLKNKNSFGDTHNFCCQNCYWDYRKKYYVGERSVNYGIKYDEEHCSKLRERAVKMIKDGKFPQTLTTPHKMINKLLDTIGVQYLNEFSCKYHSIDIYLKKENLFIEIMGDYWHATPIKYEFEKLSKTQLKSIKQDKSKNTYVKKYYNTEILYLWEKDINCNLDLCECLIKKYINNPKKLENYNSFNYHTVNNGIEINKNILNPYFITKNP